MQYESSTSGSSTTVTITGHIDFDAQRGMRELMKNLQEGDATSVRINLSGVPSIDSAGIGLLLMAHDRLTKAGKSFALTGAAGLAAKALDLARVGDLVPMD